MTATKTDDPTTALRTRVTALEDEISEVTAEKSRIDAALKAAVVRRDEVVETVRKANQGAGRVIGTSPEATARQERAAEEYEARQAQRAEVQAACDRLSAQVSATERHLGSLLAEWRPLRRQLDQIDAMVPLEPLAAAVTEANALLMPLIGERNGIAAALADARAEANGSKFMSLSFRKRDLPAHIAAARMVVLEAQEKYDEAAALTVVPTLVSIDEQMAVLDAELAEVTARRDSVVAERQRAAAQQRSYQDHAARCRNEAAQVSREFDRVMALA